MTDENGTGVATQVNELGSEVVLLASARPCRLGSFER